jgi:RNA polymerase sigma-70 factor (ECF subfamily)
MRAFRDPRLDEIESLYRERFPYFLRVATAILGDPDRGLEAVQDGFGDVVRSRRTFRGDGPLEAWVWRAVVNATRRAQGRAHPAAVAEEGAITTVNGHESRERSEIGLVVSLLPERQRLAVFLRYYADLDYRSIARALGVEVGTVSATLSAAHATLRENLNEVPH